MLVGRAAETARIDGLLSVARGGRSGVLVVRGETGIGKSALLDHASAQAAGFTVLRGAGVESETELAYAALHQVLRPVFDRIPRLPDPQAAALRAAFALSSETVDERFRVSLGVLGLLSEVADERPLLCLVDDAQWLDQASADALVFVARRLEAESVVLLFAARDDAARSFAAPGLPEQRISALSAADSRALLTERLASAVAAGALDWLVESAGGNPLALLELPTTLNSRQLAGQESLSSKLPTATSVERAYLARVRALPATAQRLLVLAAAEGTGARATVERAAKGLGLDMADLASAEAAGLLHIDPEGIAFRHPLVRTAIYRDASFTEREQAHRVLAVASVAEGSADRAAWHRAAAAVGTDDEIAAALESTAERARLRSGHAAASSALERAAELSADPDAKARRLVASAAAAWQAGQPDRATGLLERARPIASDVRLRAEMNNLHGVMAWRCGVVPQAAVSLVNGALQVAALDPGKALELLADAGLAAWDAGDYRRLAEVGRAVENLPAMADAEHTCLAEVLLGSVRLSAGATPSELHDLREAIARAEAFDEARLLVWAGIAAEVAGESALEAAILARGVALARDYGAVDRLTVALESATVQGFLSGQFGLAAQAAEGLTLARQAGLTNAASLHRATLAWLAAVQGRDDDCRSLAAEVVAAARPNGHGIAYSIAEWSVGLLDLVAGRPEQTVERLQDLDAASPGLGHPYYVLNSAPDLVEACVRTGREADAVSAFAVLESFARPGAPTWVLALAARCRALLADDHTAEQEFETALALHANSPNPFALARTQLLLGAHLRRQRQRSASREHLKAALAAFERLGAQPWADRAAGELRATGETVKRDRGGGLAQLTPQELQIVRHVCQGLSNREVGAQLFISPRTVEYHLYKAYPKLGIASRAELIRRFADDVEPVGVS